MELDSAIIGAMEPARPITVLDPMQIAVADFHRTFGLAVDGPPAVRDREQRRSLIGEEGAEAAEALRAGDLTGLAGELADLCYVLFGTAVSYGLTLTPLARRHPEGAPRRPSSAEGSRLALELERRVAATLRALEGDDLEAVSYRLYRLAENVWLIAAALNLPLEAVFAEIHRANLAKHGGGRRADGKILKPAGWQPPQIAALLAAAGREPTAPGEKISTRSD